MDNSAVHTDISTPARKRVRDNETPGQRLKREKAAERQRRKRERDRNAAGMGMLAYPPHQPDPQQPPPQQPHPPQHPQLPVQVMTHPVGSTSQGQPSSFPSQELTAEELARRDRVRAAARERQRKHRQLVKQRKMRELGLDMGNEIIPGMEEVQYRVAPDGQYHQVLPPELQPHPPPPIGHEPPFPQGQPLGGQTFASTLLLSFSCAPLLKQHLMRTLHMTNEELASLEPIIAEAWDHWDHQRRMHYAEQQAAAAAVAAAEGGPGVPGAPPNGPHPYPPPPTNGDPSHNEFRARFRSSIEVPPPFPTYPPGNPRPGPGLSATPGASGSGPGPSSDSIDPHLAGPPPTGTDGTNPNLNDLANKAAMPSSIDPTLAQAKVDS
ncbi:hypothetical protein AX17_005419 [Amanita inopinata Kibby_2008]|nr:hypothetical protein AX17_005419 [Amanita inopinata Kibby_2008]